MTSLNNYDIQEACVKINTIIEELPKYISDPTDWKYKKEYLEDYIEQDQVTITVEGKENETHFVSRVWAETGDGLNDCDCSFVEKAIELTNEMHNILTN